ncbi:MAG: dockerin type I domain-containing protein [Phycisphaerae bacterium]
MVPAATFNTAVAGGDAVITMTATELMDPNACILGSFISVNVTYLRAGFTDCNSNGVPDACDIAGTTSDDCNTNAIPDDCDVTTGTSSDANSNGVPDECEDPLCATCVGDMNGDNLIDGSDIQAFTDCMIAGPDITAGCACADMNGIGTLNQLDLAQFVNALLATPGAVCP